MEQFKKLQSESFEEYCHRISTMKDELEMTWTAIANIINDNTGSNFSADKYRKQERRYQIADDEDFICQEEEDKFLELQKERAKLSDERIQNNALIRRIAREETLKEIAHDVAEQISAKIKLEPIKGRRNDGEKEAILQISDWHYGFEIDNHWNTFNPDIAKDRIEELQSKVIELCDKNRVSRLHIVNLGDMIAGRIHLQLRLNSRIDVITQIIEVSELLAQFLHNLEAHYKIDYYDTLDNHSRLEPNIKDSMDLESLARITGWYLKERLSGDDIIFHDNNFADDIITFNVFDHNIVGVHGHKDKPSAVIQNMTMMTQTHYDLVLTAHLHHFSADEFNQTLLISNSSLMGTDDFAEKLRLSSKPSQNLIIATPDNVAECVYRIVLN